MQHFFRGDEDIIEKDYIILKGENANHIANSLRMKIGEELVVCDGNLNEYCCVIKKISKFDVFLNVLNKQKNSFEPTINLHLFQAVPKSSKLDLIVQKAVELGANSITPILTKRCISKIDKSGRKIMRLQKIAKNAAQQSKRGIVPFINNVLEFDEAILKMLESEIKILFYEYEGVKLNNIDIENKKNFAILIGSEGGFEKEEVEHAKKKGITIASLGKRILRCETAPICAISVLMNMTDNL